MATVLQSLGTALNPRIGTSFIDRWIPILIVIAWIITLGLLMFGILPEPITTNAHFTEGYATLSAAAGFYLRHAGQTPKPEPAKPAHDA